MTWNTHRPSPRIVVLGGGFAGLESAFYLRSKLGPEARITIVSDRPEFVFKPNTIYIPFGADPNSLLIPLRPPAARRDIALVHGAVDSLDADARKVRANGVELRYDFVVIATGADMALGEVPGLAEHAMIETWLRRQRLRDRVRLVWTTFEQTYIQAFGPKLHDVVTEEFRARGIEGHTDYRLLSVDRGEAFYEGGARERYDLLVAFPPYVAAVRYPALPADGRGFLATEPDTRRVVGHERIYAPGDAGDFPVKQAFLAFLQADATAEAIAADVTGRAPKGVFDPVSMCVMEELDKATFAQVPLEVTGNAEQPVAVRPDADGAYRVGVSPAWRMGKKLLGLYLPLRFKAGLPFHAGLPWRAMDLGLKGMSTLLARR